MQNIDENIFIKSAISFLVIKAVSLTGNNSSYYDYSSDNK